MKILSEEVKLWKKIAEGKEGPVYRGTFQTKSVAVKVLQKKRKEILPALDQLEHRDVIKYL